MNTTKTLHCLVLTSIFGLLAAVPVPEDVILRERPVPEDVFLQGAGVEYLLCKDRCRVLVHDFCMASLVKPAAAKLISYASSYWDPASDPTNPPLPGTVSADMKERVTVLPRPHNHHYSVFVD